MANIKRLVSTLLHEMNHEMFHQVVVHSVLLSNDQRECRIWVDAPAQSIIALNTTYRSEIQRAFTKQYPRRVVPRLIFILNPGDVEHLEAILDEQGRS